MPLDAKASLLLVGLAAHAACGAEPRTAAQSAHVDASAAAAAGVRVQAGATPESVARAVGSAAAEVAP